MGTSKLHLFASGKLHCPESELNLKCTLGGGQSFRWKETEKDQWTGIFGRKVWTISSKKDFITYKVSESSINKSIEDKTNEKNEELLIDYFRLNTSLKELYDKWSNDDPNFNKVSEMFNGIRILKQNPVENIFSFICSSNNNIPRISSMVEKLCTFYGDKICDYNGESYYDFPEVEALAKPGVQEKLRKAGFGYRAKYIHQSAQKIVNFGGKNWLDKLQQLNYNEAKSELMKLSGVGAKVADCICLMSLGHLEAVPVDTHVFQIAAQYYLPHLKSAKSVTRSIYDEIGNHFRSLYGPQAGWAHTILFCADLRKFQTTTNAKNNKRKCSSGKTSVNKIIKSEKLLNDSE